MSIKNLERAVQRLEKKLPPLPGVLFPYIDHLIARYSTLSLKHPNQPFTAALQYNRPDQFSSAPFDDLLYHDAWSPIRHTLDARWPRLSWALVSRDPFYQAKGYHDTLDSLACHVWQKSTDPCTYYTTQYTSEQELAIYHQYRQLPSPQRRQYRQKAIKDATLYYDPTPSQLELFLELQNLEI